MVLLVPLIIPWFGVVWWLVTNKLHFALSALATSLDKPHISPRASYVTKLA